MNTLKLVDFHLHTKYSGHGEGSVMDVVEAAVNQGMATIALTEHFALPAGIDDLGEYSMTGPELNAYREEVAKARERYPLLDIVYGTEIDWLGSRCWPKGIPASDVPDEVFPGYLAHVGDEYEYILGSVHFVDGWAFDNPDDIEEWDRRDVDEVWIRYFELFCEAARSSVEFTCLSHPDIVKKFGHRPSFDPRELYEQAALAVASRGRMIEVNTAGARKPVNEFYPSMEMLKAFCDADVDCTVGSDAHAPKEVGSGILEAYKLMAEAGYTQLTIPQSDGSRKYMPLGGADKHGF